MPEQPTNIQLKVGQVYRSRDDKYTIEVEKYSDATGLFRCKVTGSSGNPMWLCYEENGKRAAGHSVDADAVELIKDVSIDPRSLKPCDIVLLNGEEKMVTDRRGDLWLDGILYPYDVLAGMKIQRKKAARPIELRVGQKWECRNGEITEIIKDDGSGVPMQSSLGRWYFRDSPLQEIDSLTNPHDLIRMIQDEHGNEVNIGWYEEDDEPQQQAAPPATDTPQGEIVPFESLRAGDVIYVKRDGEWVETELYGNPTPPHAGAKPAPVESQDEIILKQRYDGPSLREGQKWRRRDGKIVTVKTRKSRAYPFSCGDGIYAIPSLFGRRERHLEDLVELIEDAPAKKPTPQVGEKWLIDRDKMHFAHIMGKGETEGEYRILKAHEPHKGIQFYAGPFIAKSDGYIKWEDKWWEVTIVEPSATSYHAKVETLVDQWTMDVAQMDLHPKPQGEGAQKVAGRKKDAIECLVDVLGKQLEEGVMEVAMAEMQEAFKESYKQSAPQKDFKFKIPAPKNPKWDFSALDEGKRETVSEPTTLHKVSVTLQKEKPARCGGQKWKDRQGREWVIYEKADEKDKERGYSFYCMEEGRRFGVSIAVTEEGFKYRNKEVSDYDLMELVKDAPAEEKKEADSQVCKSNQFVPPDEIRFSNWPLTDFQKKLLGHPRVGEVWENAEGTKFDIVNDEPDKDGHVRGREHGDDCDGLYLSYHASKERLSSMWHLVRRVAEAPATEAEPEEPTSQDTAMEQKDKPQRGDVWRFRNGLIYFVIKEAHGHAHSISPFERQNIPVSLFKAPYFTLLGRLPESVLERSKFYTARAERYGYLAGVFGGMTEAEKKASLDNNKDSSLHSEEASVPSEDKAEDEEMASKTPNHKQEDGVSASQFNEYLQRTVERLNVKVEERDKVIAELHERFAQRERDFAAALVELKMAQEREDSDNITAIAMKIDALHALTATGVDCMTDELANAIERIDRQAGDVATLLERSEKKETCPAPAPKEDETLDKGLKLTHRTLTALEIVWKIIKFAIAASIVGGGVAVCASMIIK